MFLSSTLAIWPPRIFGQGRSGKPDARAHGCDLQFAIEGVSEIQLTSGERKHQRNQIVLNYAMIRCCTSFNCHSFHRSDCLDLAVLGHVESDAEAALCLELIQNMEDWFKRSDLINMSRPAVCGVSFTKEFSTKHAKEGQGQKRMPKIKRAMLPQTCCGIRFAILGWSILS